LANLIFNSVESECDIFVISETFRKVAVV
jgi:hypothetical protein